MENPTIVIKRTKEELRTYNLFSALTRRPFRRALQYVFPLLGLLQLYIFIFVLSSTINLIIGAFLMVYPFIIRRQIVKASDQSYDDNDLQNYEIKMTFAEDYFITENDTMCQKIFYNEIYKIYNRKNDVILYLSKDGGIFLTKATYGDTMNDIINVLKREVPDKF